MRSTDKGMIRQVKGKLEKKDKDLKSERCSFIITKEILEIPTYIAKISIDYEKGNKRKLVFSDEAI